MLLRVRSSSAKRRSVALILGLVVATAALAACGSGSASSDSDGGTIKIAVAAGATSFASVYVAKERGYFEDEGVNVELLDNAGANAVPMLASKQADLAFSGVP